MSVSLIASDQFRIVVGLGKSGMSLVRFLASRGIAFAVADTREQPPELDTLRREYPQVEVRCGELDVDFLCRANELYVSPGLALATPALQQAAARACSCRGHRAVRPPCQGADHRHQRFQRQEHRDHAGG